eukprot:320185-Karenia_brevis.AAC.1
MPNFGGRASLRPQVNPFRDPSPAVTEEKDPTGKVKFLVSNFDPPPSHAGGSRTNSPAISDGGDMMKLDQMSTPDKLDTCLEDQVKLAKTPVETPVPP